MNNYTAEGKYSTEEAAKTDLDTCGYAGKWGKAKQAVGERFAAEGRLHEVPAFWDAVRLYFLELGGCWLAERKQPLPADYVPSRPLPIIPAMPYHEPQKVRFA